jgi:hypothetical protein
MAELIWDGKYDEHGKKRAPVRIELPFQTVETVNESVQERQRTLELSSSGHDPEWRNRLIWGDKKYVLPSLLPEFAGKVDLIYIDPPFNTGADFSFRTTIPEIDESFLKEPSLLEQKAYRDTWGVSAMDRDRGVTKIDRYTRWLYDAAVVLRDLLAEQGTIYVHLDYNVAHYAKVLLDDVFGLDNFRNEIIWLRTTGHSDSHKWNHSHDVLFFYSRSEQYTWCPTFLPYSDDHIESSFRNIEEGPGRKFSIGDLMAGGLRKGESGKVWRGVDPAERGGHWQYPVGRLDELDKEGRIYCHRAVVFLDSSDILTRCQECLLSPFGMTSRQCRAAQKNAPNTRRKNPRPSSIELSKRLPTKDISSSTASVAPVPPLPSPKSSTAAGLPATSDASPSTPRASVCWASPA